jgi:hypothetical protein
MGDFIESSKEASRGGFQGIKTIRGLVKNIRKDKPPAMWEDQKTELIYVDLEDAAVLEMFPGEDDFELKEGKYTFSYKYAKPGKSPTSGTPYMKCLVASAEKQGKKPSEFIGQVVTFSKIPVLLFKMKNKETGAIEEVKTENYFSFVADEGADSTNVKEHIINLILGKNIKAAQRELLVDTRAKQFPEYKDALKAGTLADKLGLVIIDDKFAKKG